MARDDNIKRVKHAEQWAAVPIVPFAVSREYWMRYVVPFQ